MVSAENAVPLAVGASKPDDQFLVFDFEDDVPRVDLVIAEVYFGVGLVLEFGGA